MKKKGGKGKYINSEFTAAIQPLFHVVPPPPSPEEANILSVLIQKYSTDMMNVPNFIRRKWAYEMYAGIYDRISSFNMTLV